MLCCYEMLLYWPIAENCLQRYLVLLSCRVASAQDSWIGLGAEQYWGEQKSQRSKNLKELTE